VPVNASRKRPVHVE